MLGIWSSFAGSVRFLAGSSFLFLLPYYLAHMSFVLAPIKASFIRRVKHKISYAYIFNIINEVNVDKCF